MAEFKKEIPFQSDDSDFNSFFGFKIDMTMGEALFKAASYGFDIITAFEKGNKVTFWLERKGPTLCSCEIQRVKLTFIKPFIKKGKSGLIFDNTQYFLICSEVIVSKDNMDGVESLLADYLGLESKYHLVDKKDHYFYKSSKINVQISDLNDKCSIRVAKKNAEHVDALKVYFMLEFLLKESGEVFFHPELRKVVEEDSAFSKEEKNFLNNLAIGVMHIGKKGNVVSNRDYFELWCSFCEFWAKPKNSEKILELARDVKKIFDESNPENSEKTKELVVKAIKCMQASIKKEEEERKKAKKEAEKAKKEEKERFKQEEVKKLTESLDDL